MQFRLVEPFVGPLYGCQAILESIRGLHESPGLRVGIGEKSQVNGEIQAGAGGAEILNALDE